MSQLEIKRVSKKADWRTFVDLAWQLNAQDPHWISPPKIMIHEQLDLNKNPYFKHAYMGAWIAFKDGHPVGRIVGVVDDNHNSFHKEQTAFFGYFECEKDERTASALFKTVSDWASSRGMSQLRGPINLSTNYECGLLVDGFDTPPSVMMTHNPPYYRQLLEKCGFKKTKDLLAYEITEKDKDHFSERILKMADRQRRRRNITFRPLRMKNFSQEVDQILEMYNDAWEANWGFVPVDPEEFRHIANDLKLIVDPNLVLICEVRGEPAGFGIALPDVNQVFAKIPDGKLLPFGIFKLLWNLKGPGKKKTVNRGRVAVLGIRRKFRELGLGPVLYAEYVKRFLDAGITSAEASWILEDNHSMNKALEQMRARVVKTYRIFDRSIDV